jgi:hypothetical protein
VFKKLIASLTIVFVVCMLALALTAGTFAHAATSAPCGEGSTADVACPELSASVTTLGHFTDTFGWAIDKDVSPDFQDLSSGGSGMSTYTIEVSKDAGTDAAWFTGNVCVTNAATTIEGFSNAPAVGVVVTADFTDDTSGRVVLVPTTILSGPSTIAADGVSVCYPYNFTVPAASILPGETFDVEAQVRSSNAATLYPEQEGALPAVTLIHNSITVTDSFNGLTYGPLTGSGLVVQYDRTFTCPSLSDVTNVATIIYDDGAIGPNDEADVHVTCPKASPPVPTPTSTTTTTTTTTPGLPNTGSDPNP